jgi:phage tail sheath protein FI
MPENLKTPGVYIVEKDSGANAVVQVATAVPVFIGYTEKASVNGKSFHMKPIMISSLSEYEIFFGGPPKPVFTITNVEDKKDSDVEINGKNYKLVQSEKTQFYLYNSLKLFFDNGGSDCYIISIGQYGAEDIANLTINTDTFKNAIALLEGEETPTMLLMPDSLLLNEEDGSYYSVQTYALTQCGEHLDKIALFDIYDAGREQPLGEDKNKYITRFRENIGLDFLSYGAAYYPWVKTNIITMNTINYTFFNLESLKEVISDNFKSLLENLINTTVEKEKRYWDEGLNSCPEYKLLKKTIADKLSVLPVTPAIAGLYTRTDKSKGVWIAPANQNLNSVLAPAVKITHREQENLNVDSISGKSINAIRAFRGRGAAIVWGARTLAGNSVEWKYVNVRRLFILIEQSIKNAAFSVVFKPNVPITWSVVKATINNFLTNLWRQGALVGESPAEAFSVGCGLGETMSQNDINEGIMRIQVKAAPSRPAEFIVISFEQKMGNAE